MIADIAVVGGGVAGLGCAAALAGVGLRVVVVERDARLGGRAASWTDEATGDVVDIGPHVVTSEHRNFLALLQRLGTADQVCWQPDPLVTLLDHGRRLRMHAPPWPVPLHGLPNLPQALRCVGLRDLLSNLGVAWCAARLDEASTRALDGIDALSLLRSLGVTPRFIDWFWTPATLALLNVPLAQCSAAALMRVFRLMLGRSGYHFGFPRIGLSELFAPGCRRAIEAAGGQVLTGVAATRLSMPGGRIDRVQLSDGRAVSARGVVLALPPQALAELVPEAAPLSSGFAPSPYVSTMLWFDRRLGDDRFWARAWRPGDLNLDFYDLANIRPVPREAPSLIAANAIHVDDPRDDAALIAQTRDEVVQFAPVAAQARLLHARVHRIPMAIPCPAPGTETRRPATATPWPGVWLAGDWTDTGLPCSMESAARSGALAAEAAAAALDRPLRVAIAPPETTGLVALLRRRPGEVAARNAVSSRFR